MRKNKNKKLLLSILFLIYLPFFTVNIAVAAETGAGGQVTTEGVILFYEEDTVFTEEQTLPKTSTVAKPTGVIPNLGVMLKESWMIGGVVMLGMAGLLLWHRRRNRDKEAMRNEKE